MILLLRRIRVGADRHVTIKSACRDHTLLSRFHLDVEAGNNVAVQKTDPDSGGRLGSLTKATTAEGG
jgi:hypothetical protein